jgi:excinuclease ABC subunit A
MGPEGGDGGGLIVAQGTPEDIAATPGSHTGRFLQPLLETVPVAPAKRRAKARA